MRDYDFSSPTAKQAAKILSRVPEDKLLRTGTMYWPRGFTEMPAFRLNDVYVGLAGDAKTFPAFNFPALIKWIDEVIGDPELAQAVETCSEKTRLSYMEQCKEIRIVIGARLTQLRALAGDEIEPIPPVTAQRS
jgi:hypothetical protein